MGEEVEDGVDSSAGSGAVGTGNDDRLAKLAAINDANDRELADELAAIDDEGKLVPFELENEEPKEEEEPKIEPEPKIEELEPKPAPLKFKIKVNGQELELTQEELIERAQKVESADRYLAEAARAKKQAETPTPEPGPTAEELQRQADEEDARIVRAIQMGTEEEAKAALKVLSARISARPSVSPDDMSRAIDERLAFNEALTKFRTDFPDITGDPLLNTLAQQRDAQLVAAGDSRPYAARYQSIGQELRAWKESLIPAPSKAEPAAEDTSLASKEAKKASAPKPIVAATKKVPQVQDEDENAEEDPSTVIAKMAKARGHAPHWMR